MVNARRLALTKALDLAPGEQLPEAGQLRGRVDAALGVLRREEEQRLAALQKAQKAAQEAKVGRLPGGGPSKDRQHKRVKSRGQESQETGLVGGTGVLVCSTEAQPWLARVCRCFSAAAYG